MGVAVSLWLGGKFTVALPTAVALAARRVAAGFVEAVGMAALGARKRVVGSVHWSFSDGGWWLVTGTDSLVLPATSHQPPAPCGLSALGTALSSSRVSSIKAVYGSCASKTLPRRFQPSCGVFVGKRLARGEGWGRENYAKAQSRQEKIWRALRLCVILLLICLTSCSQTWENQQFSV